MRRRDGLGPVSAAVENHPLGAGVQARRSLAVWLFVCCGLVFAMVVLGGVTRLTGSGLSMVDWNPIMGIIPPIGDEAWEATFARYRQFPEYRFVNEGMSLAQFKSIFWFEYWHRILGRAIGIAFFVPFLYFFARRRLASDLYAKLILIFVLGALQGLLGWYMVKSGLVDDPHVSQYRLSAHLMLAVAIYCFMLWTALGLAEPRRGGGRIASHAPGHALCVVVFVLVLIMVMSGGFVAGTRAGRIFNTFPLMEGYLVPPGLFALEPLWRNLFENAVSIQFWHRAGALVTAIAVVLFWLTVTWKAPRGRERVAAHLVLAAAAGQVGLGIATLLHAVPVALGAAHQAGALVLLTAVLFAAHGLRTRERA